MDDTVVDAITFRLAEVACKVDASGSFLLLSGEDELGRPLSVRVRAGPARLRAALPPAAREPSARAHLEHLVRKLNERLSQRARFALDSYSQVEQELLRARTLDGNTLLLVREWEVVANELVLTLAHPEHVAWAAAALRELKGPRGVAWFEQEYLDRLWEGAEEDRPDGGVLEPLGEGRYDRSALAAVAGGPARVGDFLRVSATAPAGDADVALTDVSKAPRAAKRKRGAAPARAPRAPAVPADARRVAVARGVSRAELLASADAAWAVGAPDALEELVQAKGSRWRVAAVQREAGGPYVRGAYHHGGGVDIASELRGAWRVYTQRVT